MILVYKVKYRKDTIDKTSNQLYKILVIWDPTFIFAFHIFQILFRASPVKINI